MKLQNFNTFKEYQTRIVEEIYKEFANNGITYKKELFGDGNIYRHYLSINGLTLLKTQYDGTIDVTNKIYYYIFNDKLDTNLFKSHRPKLNYNDFYGEVKAAFKKALNLYFAKIKEIKELKIENKKNELEKDFVC